MEAMAIGLPVICLDWAGMSVTTDDECAIRLPVSNPEQMPKDMVAVIIRLIDNPELRRQMGKPEENASRRFSIGRQKVALWRICLKNWMLKNECFGFVF